MRGAMLPIALLPMLLTPTAVLADDTRDWYEGDIDLVPDYHLFPRRPINAINMPVEFSCSVATLVPVRFRWRVAHPDRVNVSISSSSRSLFVDRGRGIYVRDSALELRSTLAHEGKVKCKILDLQDTLLAEMLSDYKVIQTVSLKNCEDYTFCHPDRSSCVVDNKTGLDCRCKSSYPNRDNYHGVCFPGVNLDGACVFDHECHSKVNYSRCQNGVCSCRQFYSKDGSRCVPMVKLGDFCSNQTRCAAEVAVCADGYCQCAPGFRDVEGTCLRKQVTSSTPRSFTAGSKFFKAFPTDEAKVTSIILLLLMFAVVTLYHVMLEMHSKRIHRKQLRDEELAAGNRTE